MVGTSLRGNRCPNHVEAVQAVLRKFRYDGNQTFIDVEAFGHELCGKSSRLRILDLRWFDAFEFQRRRDQEVERGGIGINVEAVVDS